MPTIKKALGPTFGTEVLSSNCSGLPFSWGPEGVDWTDGMLTSEQVSALEALITAHDPQRKPPRVATGKQLAEALGDLGQLAAWDAAVQATNKPQDRYYWLNSYRQPIPENSTKLARIALTARVSIGALFDKAVTEAAV